MTKLHISAVLPEPLVQSWVHLALLGDQDSLWALMAFRAVHKESRALIDQLFSHHMASVPQIDRTFVSSCARVFRLRLATPPPYLCWTSLDKVILKSRKVDVPRNLQISMAEVPYSLDPKRYEPKPPRQKRRPRRR